MALSLQNKFDLAKKLAEGGNLETGYSAKNGKVYNAYHTNKEWNDFLKEMRSGYNEAYTAFKDGDGGELFEKRFPPKMASYGSSSRFIFELSKDIPGFQFEKKLGICIPGRNDNQEAQASLDGYLESKCIYVEAKCREIYSASHPTFKVKYDAYYNHLAETTNHTFGFDVKHTENEKGEIQSTVSFSWQGTPIVHFDLKQILCHLLGIAKKTLLEAGRQRPTLLYLVYKPTPKHLLNLDSRRTEKAIIASWQAEQQEATAIDMNRLYECTVRYLNKHKGIAQNLPASDIERIAKSFVFKFVDQDEYSTILKDLGKPQ